MMKRQASDANHSKTDLQTCEMAPLEAGFILEFNICCHVVATFEIATLASSGPDTDADLTSFSFNFL